MNEVSITAVILPDAKVSANTTDEYKQFLRDNEGERLLVTFAVLPGKGTINQKIYWEKSVLPCLQRGFRDSGEIMNLHDTHFRAKQICPATNISGNLDAVKEDEDLNKYDWKELIEWGIRTCAEEFQIIVPEPEGSE